MSGTARIVAALRPATLVAGGAVGVHQLYYLAGFRADAARTLGDQGHAYLDGLAPLLVALGLLTVIATALAGFAGARGPEARRTPLGRALAYATAILALFVLQELAEGMLISGHPGAVGALLAHGGLVAVPFALAFGGLAWLAVRGLEAVEDRIAARLERATPPGPARRSPLPRWLDIAFSPAALAAGGAARAPPSIR